MSAAMLYALTLAPAGFGQAAAAVPPAQGVVIDQVVAVVNGDLVLESDVDEERRFQAFQPFRDQTQAYSRDKTVERLVDRTLILQQEKLQPQPPITDAEVNEQLATLRKDIPACKEYKCETDAGWDKFVVDQGFVLSELTDRWRERMEVLRFIEQRFKMGIRVSPAEIKDYYDKTLLPEYARRKATPPKLATISDRIQEILLQQQVGALLEDWLKSLKAQGSVRMTTPGEVTP
ncbi:peptidylprolyl isomerase [Granulicella arctica]|uniref:peptidylprolyl isomerase n=1 Tax=Granulicella arctica TaxID=940613 RepID=UPI0021DFE796|nr:peptidylprolyl isomerase [Granulicella arctica]